MPELPEVETIRRELAPELEGRTIRAARFHHADILLDGEPPRDVARRLRGRRIETVERRAKYLLLRLGDDLVLEVQLRMTGRFSLGRGRPAAADFAHVAAELDLDDGRTVYYDDVRRLGGFRLHGADAWSRRSARLGPEPLTRRFTARALGAALAGSRSPVKNALMDQRRIAGVGNIYASEALHRARIDPATPARELDDDAVRRLHRGLRRVLREALDAAGTTVRDYRAVNGRSGRFQRRLRVYGRADEPCPRCGTPVVRSVQAGRSTYHCPGCQR